MDLITYRDLALQQEDLRQAFQPNTFSEICNGNEIAFLSTKDKKFKKMNQKFLVILVLPV